MFASRDGRDAGEAFGLAVGRGFRRGLRGERIIWSCSTCVRKHRKVEAFDTPHRSGWTGRRTVDGGGISQCALRFWVGEPQYCWISHDGSDAQHERICHLIPSTCRAIRVVPIILMGGLCGYHARNESQELLERARRVRRRFPVGAGLCVFGGGISTARTRRRNDSAQRERIRRFRRVELRAFPLYLGCHMELC